MKYTTLLTGSLVAILMLSGCETDSPSALPLKGNINGIVLESKAADDTSLLSEECLTLPIPNGYMPVADANVTYIDADGNSASWLQTDSCGRFYEDKDSAGLRYVQVEKSGYRTMVSDFSQFENQDQSWGLVSTIKTDNSFAVRVNSEGNSLTYNTKTGKFKYTVIDTKNGRAVLGVSKSLVTFYKNTQSLTIDEYIFNNLTADLILTLDASGSMYAEYTEENSTVTNSGFDLAYIASKAFIDELSGRTQVGITVFDSSVNFLTGGFVNSLDLKDGNKDAYLPYPNSGFSKDKKLSKFMVDIYHPGSKVYDPNSLLVPEYPFVVESNATGYKWGGATAYFDAAFESIDKLRDSSADRKIILLMTDGADNSSSKEKADVIQLAKSLDTTIYTISMGAFVDQNLDDLASSTGGVYLKASSRDIGDKFKDVLSEIQNFYEISAQIDKNSTDHYRVDLNLDGEVVSGYLELNTTIVPDDNISNPDTQTPEQKEGARLFEKCMACHGLLGEKSAYNVSEQINQLTPATIKSKLAQYKSGNIDSYGYGSIMQDQVKTYTNTQIDLVSEYIPTLFVADDANLTVPADNQDDGGGGQP